MRRLAVPLRARWRSFAGEADRARLESRELWSFLRSRRVEGEPGMAAVPRFAWPVTGRLTDRFGMRYGRMHDGIDIVVPAGTPVHPALRGLVLLAGKRPIYGNVVVLGHGRDLATVYAHLESVEVAEESVVDPERQLGTVGSTGRSFGAHLHFEARFDGTPVDPLVFLPQTI